MLASLTGLGLSAAAGLNAYIPLLLVGVLARFTDVITLPEPYRWIQSGWAIAIVSILLAAELILDKVAVVDHVNDAVQTLVRPTVGGVIFAATTAAEQADNSTWMQQHPWAGVLLGVVVAGVVVVWVCVPDAGGGPLECPSYVAPDGRCSDGGTCRGRSTAPSPAPASPCGRATSSSATATG